MARVVVAALTGYELERIAAEPELTLAEDDARPAPHAEAELFVAGDGPAVLELEHMVMFPSMLVAMLLRRDEYTGAAQAKGSRND